MIIKAVKFRKDGFYTQPFVFSGEEGADKFNPNIRYRGSLQNYLIDTGKEVILVDTGLPYGTPEEVLALLKANDKTEKGEYCVVMDLHGVPQAEVLPPAGTASAEARLVEEMKKGKTLREAQEALIAAGEKKNAVKQAALALKKMFTDRTESE